MKRDPDEVPSAPPINLNVSSYVRMGNDALAAPVPRGRGIVPSAPGGMSMSTVGVAIPQGVAPGQQFSAVVNGTPIYVVCPEHLSPGQVMTLQVPSMPPQQSVAIPMASTVAEAIPVAEPSTVAVAINVASGARSMIAKAPLPLPVSASRSTAANGTSIARVQRRGSAPSTQSSSLFNNPMTHSKPAPKSTCAHSGCLRNNGVREGYCNAHAHLRLTSSRTFNTPTARQPVCTQRETPITLAIKDPPTTFSLSTPSEKNGEEGTINPNVLKRMRLVGAGAAAILAFKGGHIVLDIKRFGYSYHDMGIIGYLQLGAVSPERTADNDWKGGSWTDFLEAATLVFAVACIFWNVLRPKQGGRGASIASSLLCFSHFWPALGESFVTDSGRFLYVLPILFTLIGSFNIGMFRRLSEQEKQRMTFDPAVYCQISMSLGAMTTANGIGAILSKWGFTGGYDIPLEGSAWFPLVIVVTILAGLVALICGAVHAFDGRKGIALVLIAMFWDQMCIAFSHHSYRGCLYIAAICSAVWVFCKPGSIRAWLMTSMFYLLASLVAITGHAYDAGGTFFVCIIGWCVLWLFRLTFLGRPTPTTEQYAACAQASMMLLFLQSAAKLASLPPNYPYPAYGKIEGWVNVVIGVLFAVSCLEGTAHGGCETWGTKT